MEQPTRSATGVSSTTTSRALTILTLAGCAVATVVVLSSPHLLFGWHSPALHLVVDTLSSSVSLLVAYLLANRYARGERLQDVVLALGLVVLAVARPVGAAVDWAAGDGLDPLTLEVWTEQVLRFVAAALMASAALARDRLLPRPRAWIPPVAVAGLGGAVVLALVLARDALPVAVTESPAPAVRPSITGHPALLGAHSAGALLFLGAAIAFTVQAGRRHDELLRWVGPAFVVGAFARLHYVLYPSIYSGWVYTGDLLRAASVALLLVGAAREIRAHWTGLAETAVLEDRRRVAREIHDGVIQELSYLRTSAYEVEDDPDLQQRLLDAADRGLDEARGAIDRLHRLESAPLGVLLEQAAARVVERYGGVVRADVDPSVDATDAQRHALVRIAREAALNAVRHGGARTVTLTTRRDRDGALLVVRDDGGGFDPAVGRIGGYGLTSMRERARALPGSCDVESTPGEGTTVRVRW